MIFMKTMSYCYTSSSLELTVCHILYLPGHDALSYGLEEGYKNLQEVFSRAPTQGAWTVAAPDTADAGAKSNETSGNNALLYLYKVLNVYRNMFHINFDEYLRIKRRSRPINSNSFIPQMLKRKRSFFSKGKKKVCSLHLVSFTVV